MAIQAQPEAPTASPVSQDQRNPLAGLSIVPALVNGVQVPVACPAAWCTDNHTGEDTRHLEDVSHNSNNVDVYTPDFRKDGDQIFAYAHLGQDLYGSDENMRAAHIRVEDGGGEFSYLTPDQADTFASNLEKFAAGIRALARTAHGNAIRAAQA